MSKIFELVIIGLLILIIVFRKKSNCNYSHIASFVLIYIITNLIIKEVILSLVITCIIWGILYGTMKNYLFNLNENFDNDKKDDVDHHSKEEKNKRISYLKEVIKKLEGGIALKEDDLYEKNDIKDFDFTESKVTEKEDEDRKKKPLKEYKPFEAQKETFELINTVKQLKETVATLAPILKQGKSILSSLEALKV